MDFDHAFDHAFERVIGHEGGHLTAEEARKQGDPGGETHFGISRRAWPNEDIAGMTLERSKTIYKAAYWDAAGCPALPEAIRFDVFDTAVNSGVYMAIRLLQKAVGEFEDGTLGPLTLQAVNSMPPDRLRLRYSAQRRIMWAGLSSFKTFARGWTLRQARNDLL